MQRIPRLSLLLPLLVLACAPSGTGEERTAPVAREGTARAPDTVPSPPPAAPSADTASPPERPAADTAGWSAGITRRDHSVTGVATLREVRTARRQGHDRVVFEFEGGEIPGYHVEYVDRPIRACGSGDVVEVAGDAWLSVRLSPARAHDDRGRATITERDRRLDLPVLLELRLVCDFEAELEWVLGVATPNRYRVLELRDPTRLVVDVRH